MLKIATYISPFNTDLKGTGVSKHVIHMVDCLHRRVDVDQVLFGTTTLEELKATAADFPFKDIPLRSIPIPAIWLERLWKSLRAPPVEYWLSEADFVYSPGETLIPSQRIPRVFTLHDVYQFEQINSYRKRLNAKAYHRYLKNLEIIVTVSEFSKRRIGEVFAVDERKIHVIGNGVSDLYFRYFSMGSESPFLEKRPYIHIGGPINEKKGGPAIVSLCQELARSLPELRVVVTGGIGDDYRSVSKELVNLWVIPQKSISNEEMAAIYKGAICFLQLSRYEGFGICPLEAMAVGTPVIISQAPALLEHSRGAAMVVVSENTPQIVDIIRALMENDASATTIRERGFQHASNYRWSQVGERLVSVLYSYGL